jgi:hypothetical protein
MKRLVIAGLLTLPGAAMADIQPENFADYAACIELLAKAQEQARASDLLWRDAINLSNSDALAEAVPELGRAILAAINALADECEALRIE